MPLFWFLFVFVGELQVLDLAGEIEVFTYIKTKKFARNVDNEFPFS